MYWQAWSGRLTKELDLETEPVAVSFEGTAAAGEPAVAGRASVCQALRRASRGETVTISAETCGCPGGLVSLGLGQLPPEGKERLVDFLVGKEKVYASRAALHRSQGIVPPPLGMARAVVFAPLATAALRPDVVLFVGPPGSLHRLAGLASFLEGASIRAELTGPACRTGVTYPLVTGEVGLSLLDFGARRLAPFGEDELLLGVPFHRLVGILHALDHGAGGAREERPGAAERRIEELGRVEAA